MRVCVVDGCDDKHLAKGFCNKHYKRFIDSRDVCAIYAREMSLGDRLRQSSKPHHDTGCINWTGYILDSGYGQIKYKCRNVLTHRAAWMSANGALPNFAHVLHKCDNKLCINPEHLFLGTHADNMADKVAKDRHSRGESHGMARLTEDNVREIRGDHRIQKVIASEYGICLSSVEKIKARKLWRHVA